MGKAANAVTATLSTLLDPPVTKFLASVRANLVLVVGLVVSAENCSGGIQRSNVMLVTATLEGSPVNSVIALRDSVRA